MNKRKEDRVLREVGIKSWDELKTAGQFRTFVACFCKMKASDVSRILSQIQELQVISDGYFDEMCHTIINHEPQIMFELEDTREYVNELLDVSMPDFEKLAEVYIDFSSWMEIESSVFMETEDGSSFVSVSEALEAIRNDGDDAATDEKISMAYEGFLSGLGFSGETSDPNLDMEMVIEAVLEQAGWEGKKSGFNSRLH